MHYRLVLPRCFVSTVWLWWCDSSHREDPSGTGSDPMIQKKGTVKLLKKNKIGLQDRLSLNTGQK